jgi:AraC-like DNA-binding protein
VARAIALIEKEPERHWTLEKLAARSHISPNYLSEMFRKTTGSTYTEYLARVRVQRAEAALRNPNRRVSEIAFAVGFRSLSQFNRSFRRIHGTSPRAMRAATGPTGPRSAPVH